ncbi:MAG: BMP family ABC transporter substrate-binding protein [Candidatus Eisenbacteria bacterium]|uniref:BMP family ABC transporter substrate-binding protein n=1 Tax=Eiseniibacteriota bacterium TaxID=2212470 RepID=A0A849SNN2_UNCEI|nr:BMP family ABC transporter substrate-binding protein [Candidatus Eisenbacteria bacterium]
MPLRLRVPVVLLGLLAALALAGCAPSTRQPDTSAAPPKLKVGLVFDIGGRGDKSFNDAAYAGLERAKRELETEYQFVETAEGSDREAGLRQMAAADLDLIFGVGFLFTDDIRKLAEEYPNKKFACIDYTVNPGDVLPPNLVALKFKEEEGSFLIGALAALVSKSHKVGFVGGMQIPLIKKFEAGYRAGVKAVAPDMPVIVKYAGTTGEAFRDPAKGSELALAEYAQGADVIFHASGATGRGVFQAAEKTGRLAIGVDADQYDESPGHILTSMVKRVDVAVFETVREVTKGQWTGGVRTFGLAEKGVGWVYDDRNRALIPDAVKARVDSLEREIVAGHIVPPSE